MTVITIEGRTGEEASPETNAGFMNALLSALAYALADLQEQERANSRTPEAKITASLHGDKLTVNLETISAGRRVSIAAVLLAALGNSLGDMENQGNLHHLNISITEQGEESKK